MKELYEETEFLLTKKEIKTNRSLSLNYVGWWWRFWIISNIIENIITRVSMYTENDENS